MKEIDRKKCPQCSKYLGFFIVFIIILLAIGPWALHSLGQVPYEFACPLFIAFLFVHGLSFALTLVHVSQNLHAGLNSKFFKFFVLGVGARFLFFIGLTIFTLFFFKHLLVPVLMTYVIVFFLSVVFEVLPGVTIINWFDKQK